MTELHSASLILGHTKLLAEIKTQIESICNKVSLVQKSIDEKFEIRDRELQTAKIEMDRRLDGLNHLNAQLVETRAENSQKISDLTNAFILVREGVLKMEGRLDLLAAQISAKEISVAKQIGKAEGMGVYQIMFITAVVSLLSFIFMHYVLKF